MDKKYKIIFAALFLIMFFGSITFFVVKNKSTYKQLSINKAQIKTQDIADEKDAFVRDLCNNGMKKYYDDNFSYGINVRKCGEYYSILAEDLMDAPDIMIDRNGREVAFCGGMPSERDTTSKNSLCEIECEEENLCMNIEIDCLEIQFKNTKENKTSGADEEWYEAKRDACYWENAIRTKDKKYCDNIQNLDQKERCHDLSL